MHFGHPEVSSIAEAFHLSPYNLSKTDRPRNFSCSSALFFLFSELNRKIYIDYLVGVFTCVSKNFDYGIDSAYKFITKLKRL